MHDFEICDTGLVDYALYRQNSTNLVKGILNDIFEEATSRREEEKLNVPNNNLIEKSNMLQAQKAINRKTQVFLESDYSDHKTCDDEKQIAYNKRDSLYALKEHEEEQDVSERTVKKRNLRFQTAGSINDLGHRLKSEALIHDKSVKSSIFSAVFKKRTKKIDLDDSNEANKTYIHNNNENYVNDLKSEKRVQVSRTPSFRKKLTNFLNQDAPSLLKRSFSFKDLTKRREKEKSREKLSEIKNLEWASSLQSLVESDFGISYKDLSFINYDTQNEITYRRKTSAVVSITALHRTQSLYEKVSFLCF